MSISGHGLLPLVFFVSAAGLDENYVINYTVSKVVAMKTGVLFPDRIFCTRWKNGSGQLAIPFLFNLRWNAVALFFLNNTSRH